MTCCEHAGYDGDWFHEYCCACSSEDERIVEIIRDVLKDEFRGEIRKELPEDQAEAILAALKSEGLYA